ncbi:glycosyltransferase family 4 protein [Mangrovimonas sp. CR14]|uniref:glycosyltransferase family 4 protein n=1 Tax=Mangrovimonas sp. CR14 TaxID=2706120 RepID=UPI00141F82D9|nr:glycosyltransferase family 4 protein [Mangrovimonas sp. CR14]
MHILILYTFNRGLLSQFYEELAIRLSNDGHQVTFFSLKGQKKVDDSHPFELIIKKKGGYLRNYYEVYNILKSVQPDVVVSNFSYVNPALLFGRILGVKKNIVWYHSLNEQTGASRKQIFIKKQFLKLAHVIIANSQATKKELINAYGILDARITTIPFWTPIHNILKDVSEFQLERSSKGVLKIGCPGRLEVHKNQKLVLQALNQLKDSGIVHFKLFLAGQGKDESFLKQWTSDLLLERHVDFLGNLSHTEMIEFYQSMDVIVLPSLHEAFGLVFIEALAMGCPVLVSSSFGSLGYLTEEAHTLDGFVFDPRDANSLSQRLLPYFQGQGLEGTYFKNLYERYFNPDIIYEQIKTVLLRTNKP